MSNYSNLIDAIQSTIRENGNNEITGPILQTQMLSMINALGLGYQYRGVADASTNPGTPDAKVFYIAFSPGVYSNFDGITVTGLCTLKYDSAWRKEDIQVAGGGSVTTNPEDLTLTGNDVLQFANRAVESGRKGYLFVRPEIGSIASQISAQNTIYEIRDAFDLQNGTLNVPDDSILKFNGGRLSNGTIHLGDNVFIAADDVKIFDSVLFTGAVNNQFFHIDWFVGNYATSVSDSAPDATPEIQSMFNSGIKKVWLTNQHFYRVTSTIIIDASILVDGVRQTSQYRRENKAIFGNFDAPIITLKPSALTYGASINNLYVRRIVDSNSLTSDNGYKETIPTILVDLSVAAIWGLYINAVLYANQITATYQTSGGSMKSTNTGVGFTGIEIDSVKYCYYVRIEGEIRNFYRGVYVHQSTTGNFTGAEYNFDSNCAKGAEVIGNAKIGGFHELVKVFPSGNSIGYFRVNDDCFIDGYIWDTSYNLASNANNLFAAYYSVRAKHFKSGPGMQADIAMIDGDCREIKDNRVLRLEGNAVLASNLLPQSFYGQYIGGYNAGGIRNIIFRAFENDEDFQDYMDGDTSKGIPVDKENTFGFDNLFFPDKMYYDTVTGYPLSSNYALKSYIKDRAIKTLYFECTTSFLARATLVIFQYSTIISSVVVNRSGVDYTFNRSFAYFEPLFMSLRSNSNSEKISVTIHYEQATEKADIPYIGICGPGAASQIGPWGGSAYGLARFNKLQVVGGRYESEFRKWITHPILREYKTDTTGNYIPVLHYKVNGNTKQVESVIDINGNKFTIRTIGSNVVIYGNVLPSGTDFVVYKYSTSDFLICAKNFTNLHIDTVESPSNDTTIEDDLATLDYSTWTQQTIYYALTKSGATADRPNVPSGFDGVGYFDTTLGKMIWRYGSVWVDATGATV